MFSSIQTPENSLRINRTLSSLEINAASLRSASTEKLYWGKGIGLLGRLGNLSQLHQLKLDARGKLKKKSGYGLRLKSGRRLWIPKAIGRRLQARTPGN